MAVPGLRVVSVSGQPGFVSFGPSADSDYRMGVKPSGEFVIMRGSTIALSLGTDNTLTIPSGLLVKSLDVEGELKSFGVPQWRLWHKEDFSGSVTGWDNNTVTQCAGLTMLGGYRAFSEGEVSKVFKGLPPHSHIRIRATYHFIDAWIGETGFMRADVGRSGELIHVWTERHSQDHEQDGVNVCGDPSVSEGKFAVPIDISFTHTADQITIAFGSTMKGVSADKESWGVSSMEIYVQ
ncbi:unnamed protein product [Vitrella brassicaformis CCMP3155]|uniref:Uncharacterized protein n=1 Tax=Vitrella brassicaformis (strain CCMP3155) TaxID=1169540 RepID=A0A0G4FZL4_VITBC|nr:unnamed protein product [Vitrella brassicaformis CCMP3155]|eukprot:CEM20973.1 unnamed protein product [Vitrella brassicaformis CCMP3155]